MTDHSIDDIMQQARQGSVAAIIQILNVRLADYGIRARAVLTQGILQVLCEAETAERLEQDSLVSHIRQILGSLRPRHIRRVKINSRLVNEQQVLWLEAIKRDPEGQLLWAEEISLPRPNPVQFLIESFSSAPRPPERITVNPSSSRQSRDRRQFARGIIGGAGLSALLLALGWLAYDRAFREPELSSSSQVSDEEVPVSSTSEVVSTFPIPPGTDTDSPDANGAGAPLSSPPQSAIATTEQQQPDPFAEAVLLAQQSVKDGQTASSSAAWLEIASQWQRASDLMDQVPDDDERFATAQNRKLLYQANREEALKQANLHQAQ